MIKTKEETLESLIEKLNKYEYLLKNESDLYKTIFESKAIDNSTILFQKDRVEEIKLEIQKIWKQIKSL